MKKLTIALVLALVAVMISGGTVLAWDYEDPCVADNDYFWNVNSWDNGSKTTHVGGQHPRIGLPWSDRVADGYNLYRDDVTDSGNLDRLALRTDTPDLLDLPNASRKWKDAQNNLGWMCKMADESPDTWYWATSPRGYNDPVPNFNPPYINIILPDASTHVPYYGKAVDATVFGDGTWRIKIPAGTWILNPDGSMAVSLVVNSDGNIVSDVRFVYCRGGEVTVTTVKLP
ncbi:MAG: hypothetical protein KAW00_04900 [Dehalococcoidia bacterium]|nr:hypothetical protein [Dehalococcoidia bacterium]